MGKLIRLICSIKGENGSGPGKKRQVERPKTEIEGVLEKDTSTTLERILRA